MKIYCVMTRAAVAVALAAAAATAAVVAVAAVAVVAASLLMKTRLPLGAARLRRKMIKIMIWPGECKTV